MLHVLYCTTMIITPCESLRRNSMCIVNTLCNDLGRILHVHVLLLIRVCNTLRKHAMCTVQSLLCVGVVRAEGVCPRCLVCSVRARLSPCLLSPWPLGCATITATHTTRALPRQWRSAMSWYTSSADCKHAILKRAYLYLIILIFWCYNNYDSRSII